MSLYEYGDLMELKHIIFSVLITTQFIVPSYAINFDLDLKQEQAEIANIITNIPVEQAKQEMLTALNKMKEPNQIRDTDRIMDFGISMRENMKILSQEERVPFLNYLRKQLGSEELISKTDWYFLIETSFAKPDFDMITAALEGKNQASTLYLSFFSDNPHIIDHITRSLKEDLIKLVSQGDKKLLETFLEGFTQQANKYGPMSRSLNLFLSELTHNNLPLKLMETSVPAESLARHTIPAMTKIFSWDSFMRDHTGILLKDLFASKTNIKFFLSKFTKLMEMAYADSTIPAEERNLLARLYILDNMSKLADPAYEEIKSQARFGIRGQRNIFRQQSLHQEFGTLSKENAKTLTKIIKEVPVSRLEALMPNAKGWLQSLEEWAVKSIKSGNQRLRGIGPIIALIAAEEILRYYTGYNPSTIYLNATDEITDALATNNNVKLVYNTIYDDDFTKCFINYVEEGNLTEEQQLAYLETLDNFETAMFASYFQTSKDRLAEKDWQCFVLNENCVNS